MRRFVFRNIIRLRPLKRTLRALFRCRIRLTIRAVACATSVPILRKLTEWERLG